MSITRELHEWATYIEDSSDELSDDQFGDLIAVLRAAANAIADRAPMSEQSARVAELERRMSLVEAHQQTTIAALIERNDDLRRLSTPGPRSTTTYREPNIGKGTT